MKLVRPTTIATAVLSAFCILGVPTAAIAQGTATAAVQKAPIKLLEGQWDDFNRAQLDSMIQTYGKGSPNYNPEKPPYAVFDFDNTTIFLDIAEALLVYQLENLRFAATPAQMDKAVRMNIDNKNFDDGHKNKAGKTVNIDRLAKDIVKSYTWIYQNFEGMQGNKPLSEIKKAPQYKDFITKVRFAYEAIGDTFDHAVSYPWVTYLHTGLTSKDVRRLTAETMLWQMGQPVEAVTWESPADMAGEAGMVSVTWKNGARIVPEMQDLYAKLRAAGIDVYVCSASFVDIIKEMASNPAFGYNNSDKAVYAMELERDAKGVILPEFKRGYDQTQGPGKTATINRFLVPHYGYGPILVAGDSEGDQNMMGDFPDMKIGLIINRLRSSSTDIGKFSKMAVDSYGKQGAKYLLQGRDDNKGVFVKSQLHYKLGSTEGQAVR